MAHDEIGFTGTQDGMTLHQSRALKALLCEIQPGGVDHGDCVGSDAEFHRICRTLGYFITVHPPTKGGKRAFCEGDLVLPPAEYLIRNKNIVNRTKMLIATPKDFVEELRSGTWATIRYARKLRRTVYIIWPSGKVQKEIGGQVCPTP